MEKSSVIWSKTEAGRAEVQARALVKERLQRNLLLLIDGVKSEEMLLANVVGLKPEDFKFLESLNLIAPVAAPSSSRSSSSDRAHAATQPMTLPPETDEAGGSAEGAAMDYGRYTAALTQLISSELGLRGFTLTLAVEKASTVEELRAVGERVLEQIRERKGDAAADRARRALSGS